MIIIYVQTNFDIWLYLYVFSEILLSLTIAPLKMEENVFKKLKKLSLNIASETECVTEIVDKISRQVF